MAKSLLLCQLLHVAHAVNWAQRLLSLTENLRELPNSLDITLLARHATAYTL